jgi:lysophospholipase
MLDGFEVPYSKFSFQLPNGRRMNMRYAIFKPRKPHTTVVLYTGRAGYIDKYRHTAEWLTRRGHQVIIPEMLNYGGSDRFLAGHKAQRDHVEDFRIHVASAVAFRKQVVEKVRIGRVFLVGHSHGALVATRTMSEHRDLQKETSGLVLIAPTFNFTVKPLHALLWDAIFPRPWYEAGERRIPAPEYLRLASRFLVRRGFGERYAPGEHDFDHRDQIFKGNRLTHDERQFFEMIGYLTAEPDRAPGGFTIGHVYELMQAIRQINRPGYLERIELPVAAITGELDILTPPDLLDRSIRRMPYARHETVPGAKHDIPGELPPIRADLYRKLGSYMRDYNPHYSF